MPTSDQLMTFLMMRKREGNGFFNMPRPVLLRLIGGYYQSSPEDLQTLATLPIYNKPYDRDESDLEVQKALLQNEVEVQKILKPMLEREKNPISEISILLHYVAFGNTKKIKEMLERNPELLLKTGDVMLPSGDTVFCVAPYECLLGTGDHYQDMHDIFNDAFKKIEGGEDEKYRQYERYKPHIDNIIQDNKFKQPAYDFKWIIDLIKKSSLEEIAEELKTGNGRNLDYRGKKYSVIIDDKIIEMTLRDALERFRQDFSPRIMTAPCMHYNYNNLYTILKLLYDEWDNLVVKRGNDNYYKEKCRLVWKQLVGFVMRGLPACELQAYAECLDDVIDNKASHLKRTFKIKNGNGCVPIAAGDRLYSGLGFDFAFNICVILRRRTQWGGDVVAEIGFVLENLCRTKASNLQNLCNHIIKDLKQRSQIF